MRKVTAKRILSEIASIAFSDLTKFVSLETLPEGEQVLTVTDSRCLSADSRRALCSVKAGTRGVEVKLYDKLRALEILGRAYGAFAGGDDEAQAAENFLKLFENEEFK